MYAVFNVLLVGQDLVDDDGLADDLADRLSGVQRSVGILEDDLHILAQRLHIARVQLCDILAVEDDLAAVRLFQPVQAAQERGFAAAGGADQHHAVAFVNGQVYAFQHLQTAVILFQSFNVDHFVPASSQILPAAR